ncbi:zinc-ribbon domain-containing protein [Gardnerella sp. KA00255]|uniref:zinc-ribbon domain-containing protein n=1 Tax=Gardnerella sp. KA00255 TaxID=2749073 RepID=UPI003BA9C6F8
MFCINCGNKLESSDKFCTKCGTPADNASKKPFYTQKKFMIPIIAVVVLVLICSCTGIALYVSNKNHSSLFSTSQSIVIPKVSQSQSAQSVVDSLHKKGANARLIKEFSAKNSGDFVRYKNVKQGDRVDKNHVVEVVESKGPGVPEKGVVGASLEKAEKIVKSMGVTVKLHHVPATDSAVGKIVASSPVPGNAVGKDDVIHIAVGENTDGVPVNVFGMDKEKAKDMLSSKPFSVDLRPKFSSAKYFGKIVGAYPALGTKGNPKSVTLYYGVDASKAKDVVTEPMDLGNQTIYLVNHAASFIGKWCTKSGNCINLLPRLMSGVSELDTEEKYIEDLIPADIADKNGRIPDKDKTDKINLRGVLTLTAAGQDPADRAVFDKNVPNTKYMRNNLISGDTGAVELYAGGAVIQCGDDDIFVAGYGSACVNGKYVDFIRDPKKLDEITHDPGKDVGLYYTMQDFMVVVPVGAKFDKLLNSGYFVGKGETKPDLTRPFILRRNPKLYKETRKNLPAEGDDWVNPFIPTERSRAVPFAPAPDDSNAYYLVEEPFNWDTSPSESL